MNDWQLLRDYADRGSEAAFRELVNRHLNLVAFTGAEPANRPPEPPRGLTGDAAELWRVDFWSSETNRVLAIRSHSTRAIVSPDGSFEFEEPLAPGDYRFRAIFKSWPFVEKMFSMPAPDDASAASLDLGAIPVGPSGQAAAQIENPGE